MDKLFCDSISEYLELEKNTLKVLHGSKYIWEECFQTNLKSVYSQALGGKFSTLNLYLRFCSSAFGSKSHEVSLGGYFFCSSNRLTRATYSAEIFGAVNSDVSKKIVSRLHFDYSSRNEPNASQHPVFHIQMWGELPKYLEDSGVGYQFKDNSAMSCPRVPFAPMSLALFLDMIIKELGTDKLRRLLWSTEWQGLVKQHEEKILMSFFKRLQDCLSRGDHLSKFYYVDR